MKWKHHVNTKRSFTTMVSVAVLAGFVLQAVCCAVAALLLEKGSIPEEAMKAIAVVIRVLGVAAATFAAFTIGSDNKIAGAATAASVVLVVPVLLSLLLWGLEGTALLIGCAASVGTFGLLIWMLNRSVSRGLWTKQNKRYR